MLCSVYREGEEETLVKEDETEHGETTDRFNDDGEWRMFEDSSDSNESDDEDNKTNENTVSVLHEKIIT